MAAHMAFAAAVPVTLTSGYSQYASGGTSLQSRPSTSAPRRAPRRRQVSVTAIFPWLKKKEGGVDEVDQLSNFTFDIGYAFLAHPAKATGEDAFFVQDGSIGVFDGVSTVQDALNVDPRLYSQTLARLTSSKVKELGPGSVVKAAIEASLENDQMGASTACVVGMEPSGRLFGVNLGDSGVVVVRDGEKLFATKPQQHFHNCPYQLTSISNAGYNSGDSLTMGQNVQLKLREDDVLVVATDGLWDNIPMDEVIERAAAVDTSPQEVADKLADMATENQLNKKYRSPFQKAAEKAGQEWEGGKEDDLTIVVGRVTPLGKNDVKPTKLLSTIPNV